MLKSFFYMRDDGAGFHRACEVFTRGRIVYYRRDKGRGLSPQKDLGRKSLMQLEKLIDKHRIRGWDGFFEEGESGWVFSVSAEYDNGDTVAASGRGFFPKGAKAAFPAIEGFFEGL